MFTDRCNTEKSTETAPLLDLKGKSVLKRSEEGATGGNQVLEGLPRVDSIVCSSGVRGTKPYFGCLMYKKSSWDQAAEQFLAARIRRKFKALSISLASA